MANLLARVERGMDKHVEKQAALQDPYYCVTTGGNPAEQAAATPP